MSHSRNSAPQARDRLTPARLDRRVGCAVLCSWLLWVAPAAALGQNASAGLWMGDVVLTNVTRLGSTTGETTASTASMRVLLHVDAAGKVRLLKDVIVATQTSTPFAAVLVTRPALLASLMVERDPAGTGNALGQRFSTAAYDFTDNDATPTDNALDLTGSLAVGGECTGTLVLDAPHPTNPFRHKFHPDHANTGAQAYAITRAVKIQITTPITETGGVSRISGQYEESLTGLHRASIRIQGALALTRVSTTSTLNP